MKHTFLVIALALCALTCPAQKRLTILHTNDTHSCVLPIGRNVADTLIAGRGGFVRRVAAVEAERKTDPDLLLFDSGDFSQGSPYYTIYKGDVETGLLDIMRYDAATIGNHEFDFGLDNMARLFRAVRFPVVCCNYDFRGTPVEGAVREWVVLRRKGLRIGVVGVAPKMEGLVDENKCRGVRYLDPATTADSIATMLKTRKHCDLVVCLSHLGWNIGGDDDQRLIARSHHIDLVLGGHSHTYFTELQYVKNADGREIPVNQNGKNAVFVGKITVEMKRARAAAAR